MQSKSSFDEQLRHSGRVLIPAGAICDVSSFLRELGPLIPADSENNEYRDLVPYSRTTAPKASMSAFVGTDEQPMHTDRAHVPTPPRYVALQCINPGETSCSTSLWISDTEMLTRDRPQLLTNAQWVFSGGQKPFYSPIVEWFRQQFRLRFDPCCMRPAGFCQKEISDACNLIKRYARLETVEWHSGTLLILDNWQCLHGRAVGSHEAPSRRLRRWYIGGRDGLGQ
jgi:hypothetical protein